MSVSVEDNIRDVEHWHRQVVDIVYVASATILLYDLILTLRLEVSFVWFSRWNYTKALYLLTRYVPIAANGLILYNHLIPDVSDGKCAGTFEAAGWLYLVSLDLAEVILAIRTWACWGRNKWVGIGLVSWTLFCQIPSVIFMHKFLASLKFRPSTVGAGLDSCFVDHSNRLLWVNWLVFLTGEGITVILMAIFAYRTSRDGDNTPFVKLIYRDGLIFYVYILCVTSINIALTLTLDGAFVALISPVQTAIHSVLTTRIILNIREAASHRLYDHSFDLHLSDTGSQPCISRISFAENPAVLHPGGDQESAIFPGRGRHNGGLSMGRAELISVSTRTTVSHVTLPMTRDARGKRVVGIVGPDHDDDRDSMRTSPEDWV